MPFKDRKVHNKYQSDRQKNLRLNWLKENGPCIDCGSSESLEVDHVDTKLKISHRIWSWSSSRRVQELNKCVVRCKSCHIKKSNKEKLKGEVPWAKLSEEDVIFIRSSDLSGTALASRFNVDKSTISDIRLRKTWKHL